MKTMTDNHIETALRAAMERRAAKVPSLPDDFAQQVMNKMNARKENANQHRVSIPLHYGRLGSLEQPLNVAAAPQRGANPHSRRRAGWGWVLSIVAVLLIAFLLWPEKQETPITQPESQPVIAEVNPQPVPKPIVEEKKEETLMPTVQAKKQPAKKRRIVQQPAEPAEEITPAEPAEEFTIAMVPTFDSYADIEAEMIDIRRRGERIEAMVADMIRSY